MEQDKSHHVEEDFFGESELMVEGRMVPRDEMGEIFDDSDPYISIAKIVKNIFPL